MNFVFFSKLFFVLTRCFNLRHFEISPATLGGGGGGVWLFALIVLQFGTNNGTDDTSKHAKF